MMPLQADQTASRKRPYAFWHEYLRPWKLATYAIGLGLLVVGSFHYKAPDWDIPISIIMSFFTYFYFVRLNSRHLPSSSDIMQRIVFHVICLGVDNYDVNSNTRIALLRWSPLHSRISIPTSRRTCRASRAAAARSKTLPASICMASSSASGATWRRWPRPSQAAATSDCTTC